MKNSEIAEGTAEVIRERGWTQGTYQRETGLCLIGAARVAMKNWNGIKSDLEAGKAILPGIPNKYRQPYTVCLLDYPPAVVTEYNDKVLTTKEQAIDTLMDAAKYWRDKGE